MTYRAAADALAQMLPVDAAKGGAGTSAAMTGPTIGAIGGGGSTGGGL